MTPTLFLVLATLGVGSALGTVLARNLVHAALYLVAFFFLVACQFVLLEAEFLAAVQVLVYIGAVTILLMFGIMLTRDVKGDETTSATLGRRIPAALVSLGFLAVIVIGVRREGGMNGRAGWATARDRPAIGPSAELRATPRARAINDMGRALGDDLMGRYALPFEVAGLLLTAALVGSIALAMPDREDEPAGRLGGPARRGFAGRAATFTHAAGPSPAPARLSPDRPEP